LADSLWAADGFLANGMAEEPHADQQPILLSVDCIAPNGATMVLLADGVWREEATGFDAPCCCSTAPGPTRRANCGLR
jgi:DNA polymerase-3 subunit chi